MNRNKIDGRTLICYENIGRRSDATLSGPSEAEGFPIENAFSGLGYDSWQATSDASQNVNISLTDPAGVQYVAMAGHNLAGGTVRLRGSLDGGATLVDLFPSGARTIQSNDPFVLVAPRALGFDYFRIGITTPSGTAASVRHISLGSILKMQRGIHDGIGAPEDMQRVDFSTPESEGGLFLGRSVTTVNTEMQANFTRLTKSWARQYWRPFADACETGPFFLVWDSVKYPNEVIFGYATSRPMTENESGDFVKTSLSIRGEA